MQSKKAKVAMLVISIFTILNFVGCGKNQKQKNDSSKQTPTKKDSSVDFDFTDMNYNILNSMNFEMAVEPEKFYGKKIKMRGQFFSTMEPDVNQRFYSCVVYDPTACCQAGMDFVLSGEKKFPEDFPEELTLIEIEGTFTDFSTYFEDGRSYSAILCDQIKVLD